MTSLCVGEGRALDLIVVSCFVSYGMQFFNLGMSLYGHDNFTGFVEFVPVAVYGWITSDNQGTANTLATAALVVWSLRLTAFLLYRMSIRTSTDTRLGTDSARAVGTLGVFWPIHGTWGVLCSLPVTLLNGCNSGETDLWWVAAGSVIWACGFVLESYADQTKCAAYANETQPYYSMGDHWLWQFSRNPNFCGETLCWLGVALIGWGGLKNGSGMAGALCWIAPVFTLMIMLGEAVLLTEVKMWKRFSALDAYQKYRQTTSVLWLCPRALYVALPWCIRQTLFFDFSYHEASHLLLSDTQSGLGVRITEKERGHGLDAQSSGVENVNLTPKSHASSAELPQQPPPAARTCC